MTRLARPAMAILVASLLGGSAQATTLLFDFGRTDAQTSPGWNNVIVSTTTLLSVVDSNDAVFGTVGFEITDTFFQTGEPSRLGSEAPAGDAAAYPVSATDDYFFGHTTPFAGADPNPLGQFKLFNLDPTATYDFTFFASRQGINDTRDAEYTVSGLNSASGVLDASNNDTEVLVLAGITADANDEIFVDVTPGPNNDNGNGFYYIGLVQVDVVVPEPSTAALVALAGFGLLATASGRREHR